MRPVHKFCVVPSLPPAIEGLRTAAYTLRWCWSHDSVELFRRLDRDLWEKTGHNPVLLLGTIEQAKLENAARDDPFLAHLRRVESNLETYLAGVSTRFRRTHAESGDAPFIAYFSAEFGLTECLSIQHKLAPADRRPAHRALSPDRQVCGFNSNSSSG